MKDVTRFDDIRPYRDEEIPAAMRRIAESEYFPLLASYVYPGEDVERVRALIRGFRTIRDFQLEVMRCVNEQVLARSVTEFTYGGVERLDTDKRYLFVSNHRDIMLDSCLLQYILYRNGHETTEITFGANLMCHPLVIDIGKANKMFRVERGGNMKEFYRSSMHLSDYIRHVLTEKKQSVWIAQRNGRTKDGNDLTDQGIIKMFGMSKPDDKVAALAGLNIVPVAVSYEWEPCDMLKCRELYESREAPYVKKPGEDLNSILTGIAQPKGRVHIEFCPQITEADLMPFSDSASNEYHKQVAALIDERIHRNYRLMPANYIAHDLRSGQAEYAGRYTTEQKNAFVERMSMLQEKADCDMNVMNEIFLNIYANPVKD